MPNKKHKTTHRDRGTVLVASLLTMGVMMVLGAYFLSFSLTGSKMALSQEVSAETYYLAEAGVSEAIFKLQNDPAWKAAFETAPTPEDPDCSSWSIAPEQRTGDLFENGSYTIGIVNVGCAEAEVIVTSTVTFADGKVAQRVVRTGAYKAMGMPISDFSIFVGGQKGKKGKKKSKIEIKDAKPFNVHGGSIFSNDEIKLKGKSDVEVEGTLFAHKNINIDKKAKLTATSCAENVCDPGCAATTTCPPAQMPMPAIDFPAYLAQSEASDCSFVRIDGKTDCLFKSKEFEEVMWDNHPQLSLPVGAVVYVKGKIKVRGGLELIVNGLLVSDKDIDIGKQKCWGKKHQGSQCGNSKLIVQRPGAPEDNLPSGIIAKKKIKTGKWLGDGDVALDIHGLVYAGHEVSFSSADGSIAITGGIVARKFKASSLRDGVDLYADPDVIIDTFADPDYSPVIAIDYWEEEY